ncbi:FAD/NAD(P)-binding domain-containing protein [Favolaschia claudopus]|uniref:FAD/NAD(P)-binding domain-containing protein n=1 Tax=Favolaschia claudopus TaxID=2862362 RepID=A0AAW0CHG4_9AGAR
MSPTKVIIVGCGIAGPVLALLLKQKGYEPVIYERGKRDAGGGLSLMLQLNGLRVLSKIPGLVEKLSGMPIDKSTMFSIVPSDERLLVELEFPEQVRQHYGVGLMGVQRSKFLALLVDTVIEHGIELHFERQVVDVETTDEYARVKLNTGETDTASFVVGCDGLHSNVRTALFGMQQATFTGLTQTGGITEGVFSNEKPTMFNFYGLNMHCIAYAISKTQYSWAITQRESETKETWRAMDEAAQHSVRNGPFSQLPSGVGDLVLKSAQITKYGLYDRPKLESWHRGRVILIGDAAHATSPHLGQGANQAFEDADYLVQLLVKHRPNASQESTTAEFSAWFKEFEEARIERTAMLVRGARETGETRVVDGLEEARKRNDAVCAQWAEGGSALRRMQDLYNSK